jgi:DNA repair exonuclease SbcCD ATPase subunit
MSDDGLDDLFQGPLDAFIKRRDALAAERKKAGDKPGAAAVKALAKPAASAHAVNRLWSSRRDDFDALLAAGEALREAVRQGGGDAVREAQKRQRALVGELREAAGELLEAEGLSATAATLERVAKTLGAISTRGNFSPGAAGRLSADLEPPGLDELMDVVVLASPGAVPAPPTKPAPPSPPAPPPIAEGPTEEERRAAAEAEARAARRKELEDAVRRADAAVETSQAALDQARANKAAFEDEARDLMSRLEALQKPLLEATTRVERATTKLNDDIGSRDAARERLSAGSTR